MRMVQVFFFFNVYDVDTMQPHIVVSLPGDNSGHPVLKSLHESRRAYRTAHSNNRKPLSITCYLAGSFVVIMP